MYTRLHMGYSETSMKLAPMDLVFQAGFFVQVNVPMCRMICSSSRPLWSYILDLEAVVDKFRKSWNEVLGIAEDERGMKLDKVQLQQFRIWILYLLIPRFSYEYLELWEFTLYIFYVRKEKINFK